MTAADLLQTLARPEPRTPEPPSENREAVARPLRILLTVYQTLEGKTLDPDLIESARVSVCAVAGLSAAADAQARGADLAATDAAGRKAQEEMWAYLARNPDHVLAIEAARALKRLDDEDRRERQA